MEVFDVLGYRFNRKGKGAQGVEKTLRQRNGKPGDATFIFTVQDVLN